MHLSTPLQQCLLTTLLIFLLTPRTITASAITKSACVIPTTTTTTIAIDVSSFALANNTSTSTSTSTNTSPLPASTTTALWQIDPVCLPGVAQCHHFGDRFRYCNATGFWVPNYCGGNWICCAFSSRNGIGPMCEDFDQCDVVGRPGMAMEWWE